MLKFLRKNCQLGVTLLETILVLSLIAIILIGSISIYSNTKMVANVNRTVLNISKIAIDIKKLYDGAETFDNLDEETLITEGIIPEGMVSNTGDIISVFRGNISISNHSVSYPSFRIRLFDLPKKVCVRLLVSDVGAFEIEPDISSPATIPEALESCKLDTNSLGWIFHKYK